MKHNVFRASFSISINHSNPNGIIDILEVENDVLKTLIIQIEIPRPMGKKAKWACDLHSYLNVLNAIFDLQNIKLSNWKS